MNDTAARSGAGAAPDAPARARTLRAQRLVNLLVRAVLRTPLLCRIAGRRLVTVYVVGRSSGRRFAVPVAYTRGGDTLLIGSAFGWLHNLRTGEPVAVRLRGRRVTTDVEVLRDKDPVVDAYRMLCRDNHAFAGFARVALDGDGEPDEEDLRAAWAAGARAVRLTPRRAGG